MDFFDYWPGYDAVSVELDNEGKVVNKDQFLVVANINTLQKKWGVTPYEVWISLEDPNETDGVYQWIED